MSVVVLGAGAWGKNVARTFHELGALDAVVETDATRAEQLRSDFPGVTITHDLEEVIRQKGPRAAAVATPAPTHFYVAQQALGLGLDVFVEKPLTIDVEQAMDLDRMAREKGRLLMVGHLLVHQPAVQWMASFLREGGLGKVLSLHQERLNFGRARAVENALWSLGVHDVAVLLWLLGEKPTSLRVSGQCAIQRTVEDDVFLHLDFPCGVQAHLHVSWLWPTRSRKLTIVGEKGMLVFDELAGTVTLHQKSITPELSLRDEGESVVFRQSGEPLKLELSHFLERIKDRRPPLTDGASGVAVVQVLAEATRALRAQGEATP